MPYKDPDASKAYHKKYRQEHTQEMRGYLQKWRGDHVVERKECSYNYYREHMKEFKEHVRKYGIPYKRMFTEGGGVWACNKCSVTWEDGARLDIHHKDQDHSNNAFENLVCLCKTCHENLHAKWQNEVIQRLVRDGVVDWNGDYTRPIKSYQGI